jgi:hypothetical protein
MRGDEPGAFGLVGLPGGRRVGRLAALDAIPGILHAVTTRQGFDVVRARQDRAAGAAAAAEAMGTMGAAFCEQVHGNAVLAVDRPGLAGRADGLVTATGGLALCAFSADCPLILAADADGSAVGVAHASWRGTVAAVAGKLIAKMAGELGCRPERIVAAICPSAGPCCYEVGEDVRAAAAAALGPEAEGFVRPSGAGKYHFDLWAANRAQLVAAGVREANLHVAGVCTICRNDLFPSYRAEGETAGRFVAGVAIKRSIPGEGFQMQDRLTYNRILHPQGGCSGSL